jgi:hypothetical protein
MLRSATQTRMGAKLVVTVFLSDERGYDSENHLSQTV